MAKLTASQVRALALGAGFTDAQAPTVVAIAFLESGFDTNAVGDTQLADPKKWGPSIGLMQIRSLRNPSAYTGADALRDASKLTDPTYNMRVAKAIYDQKGGFSDWSTYQSRNKPNSGWTQAIAQGFGADDPATGIGAALDDAVTGGVNAVASPLSGLDAIGSLAGKLQDGQFWRRIGIGAAGGMLILFGLLFLLVTSGAAKSAAGVAVSAVPGGGVVKTAVKAVRQ